MEIAPGELLRRVRTTQRLSQGGLGKLLGCSAQYISAVERGSESPAPGWWIRAGRAVGVRPAELLPQLAADLVEGRPEQTLEMVPGDRPGAWYPRGPRDEALARELGGIVPMPVGELLARAAGERIAVVFRSDVQTQQKSEAPTKGAPPVSIELGVTGH